MIEPEHDISADVIADANAAAELAACELAYRDLHATVEREQGYRVRALAEVARTSAELASARQELAVLREQNDRLKAHLDEVVAAYDALVAHSREPA